LNPAPTHSFVPRVQVVGQFEQVDIVLLHFLHPCLAGSLMQALYPFPEHCFCVPLHGLLQFWQFPLKQYFPPVHPWQLALFPHVLVLVPQSLAPQLTLGHTQFPLELELHTLPPVHPWQFFVPPGHPLGHVPH
jgi:hypothetical protein